MEHVAYTARKSTAGTRLPLSSSCVRLGCAPCRPPFTWSPITNSGAAVPWSVPPSPFSSGRRPNSENVITVTCERQRGSSVVKNASIAVVEA